ncbi:hypothetical protein [Streptomyces tubercidicus]|uniref:hypothetical protein n=1 Tax=Streptomyces tubercidicus TaxID=47759 RepID=UPI00346715F8
MLNSVTSISSPRSRFPREFENDMGRLTQSSSTSVTSAAVPARLHQDGWAHDNVQPFTSSSALSETSSSIWHWRTATKMLPPAVLRDKGRRAAGFTGGPDGQEKSAA